MTAAIAIELAKLQHDAVIEMFELDATPAGGQLTRFHAGTNQLRQNLVWQGNTYVAWPVQAEGFALTAQGSLPRPTLRAANILGLIGAMVLETGGLRGALVRRRRTLARFLDAANFPGGTNPDADPTAEYPTETWRVDRVSQRNKLIVELELASPWDAAGVLLPRRQVLADVCTWAYRGPDCGYTGPAVARADDTPTTDLAQDACGGRLSSCRLRQWPGGELPFGGFPGAGVYRDV